MFLVADPASAAMDAALGFARTRLGARLGQNLVSSFLVDGVLSGAGTVLAFMPQIVLLSVALDFLEASGYLSRGALVDRVLRLLGLSGRAFLPLLMGHACAVPAISSTRIVRDPRERLTTILVLPLMTCSARIPTYALLISTFFAARGPGVPRRRVPRAPTRRACSRGLPRVDRPCATPATKGRLPLALELPRYRLPEWRVVLGKAQRASRRFLRDVGTTIVVASTVLWVLLKVPAPTVLQRPDATTAIERSVAATVGHALEPVTRPAGFDWRINVGLIGLVRRPRAHGGHPRRHLRPRGPRRGRSVAALGPASRRKKARRDATLWHGQRPRAARLLRRRVPVREHGGRDRRETKTLRWPVFVLAYTYAVAYVLAVIVFQAARAFT